MSVKRLDRLAAEAVCARGDLAGLTAPVLAGLPAACAEALFLELARTLRLTPALARAFAQSGHERLAAVAGRLDAAAGVVGGLATTCRD